MAEIWAKKPKNGGIITLKQHTEDLINNLDKLFGKFPYKINGICKDKLLQLLKYASFFHDLGKVSPYFQQKVVKNENYFVYEFKDFPNIRHNIFSLFFIDKEKVKEICNNDDSLYSTFLSSIATHHWKKDEKEYLLNLNENLIKACKILLKNDNGRKLADILIKHFNNFKIGGKDVKDLISFDEHLTCHIEKGGDLISVGIIPPYTLYFLPERLKLEKDLKIDLNLWIFLSGFLMRIDHFSSFCEEENNNFEIEKENPKVNLERKLGEKFSENFWQKEFINYKNENIILVAPTGIGKTEFAFLWAEGEKFFYTLPLRVATNQIFDRACRYFNEDKKDDEDPFIKSNVGLLHSDADLYIIDKWETTKDTNWDGETPKIIEISRHFSLPVNISTGDQIFPSALKYPSYEKIYATIGYSKLIIDEVQAYNPEACAIIVKMIEDIVSLGGKFLLMTATLPKFINDLGVSKWAKIIDLYEGKIKTGNEEKDTIKIKNLIRHKIKLIEKDIEEDIDEIIKKANESKRVLVVLNTIEKAENIYKKIKDRGFKGFLELIHSRFTLNERKRKEQNLEKEFQNPKPENENFPKILVATQVIEVSLDIDANYLFTEISPIDSLIQRMGRVMRRVDLMTGRIKESDKEFSYEDFYKKDEPNILIYYQKEKDRIKESGKGKVYETELIQRAYEVLKNKKEIGENEKQNLVCEFYKNLENSKYLQKFYETLTILNSGYVSENMKEAHELFRKIYTIPMVSEDKLRDIVNKINGKDNINWIWFKKEIIAEYVINENMWEYREYELESLWDLIEDKIQIENIETKEKFKNYCLGIYVPKKNSRFV